MHPAFASFQGAGNGVSSGSLNTIQREKLTIANSAWISIIPRSLSFRQVQCGSKRNSFLLTAQNRTGPSYQENLVVIIFLAGLGNPVQYFIFFSFFWTEVLMKSCASYTLRNRAGPKTQLLRTSKKNHSKYEKLSGQMVSFVKRGHVSKNTSWWGTVVWKGPKSNQNYFSLECCLILSQINAKGVLKVALSNWNAQSFIFLLKM